MQADRMEILPLACVPGAIPAAERQGHFALIERLFAETAEGREALADGYAFRFPPTALEPVARFVANERKCCPFLSFVVVVPPAEGFIRLRITGPEGTRAFLDSELPIQGATHG